MLLDADGRRLRRRIGYFRAYVEMDPTDGGVSLIGCDRIDLRDDDGDEEFCHANQDQNQTAGGECGEATSSGAAPTR